MKAFNSSIKQLLRSELAIVFSLFLITATVFAVLSYMHYQELQHVEELYPVVRP